LKEGQPALGPLLQSCWLRGRRSRHLPQHGAGADQPRMGRDGKVRKMQKAERSVC